MKKPRIVLADLDETYIIPLQLKWAEDYFDQVDLEIITNEDYFSQFFSSPQSIDILIISESLFDGSLQKHQIIHTYLMTEQYEEDKTAYLNVNPIYKYTSIKEIFLEITGKSADVLQAGGEVKKETQVVLVYSASGGVGKTTLSLGICASLTKSYKRVLYVNADRLQTFQCSLENKSAIADNALYMKLANGELSGFSEISHVLRHEQFTYLPPFKASTLSLGISYGVFAGIVSLAKKSNEFDYIVVDADCTFDDDKVELFRLADKVIVVTTQTYVSVFATNLLVDNINGVNSQKYVFVCNSFVAEDTNALISPQSNMHFSVNEYVHRFAFSPENNLDLVGADQGVQSLAFLVM